MARGMKRLGLMLAISAGLAAGVQVARASVELLYFHAQGQLEFIHLEWETASELDNLGFNLYRATSSVFEEAIQLNDNLIPSQVAGQPIGAYYEWQDDSAAADTLYTYWLESVDVFGVTELHPPAQAALEGGTILPTQPAGTAPPQPTRTPGLTPVASPTGEDAGEEPTEPSATPEPPAATAGATEPAEPSPGATGQSPSATLPVAPNPPAGGAPP
ncbi:MAG: hypothetical protein ACRDHL_05935, partial [Candidatus Promineifilaceae bacterium]